MVAFKAAEVESFVARPDPDKPIVLVFGPDTGLVHERAAALVRASVNDVSDPFGLALLDGDKLAETPERLVEEAHTIPLLGGRRAVLVKAGARNFTAAVERLINAPPRADCRIVIEAGDLRRGAPLRTMCERAPIAAALPCYADSARDLARLIDEEMRRAGMTITPSARALLVSLIGGDRCASRSEIEKLTLYALNKRSIDVPDVMAVAADATLPAVDSLIDAAFAGWANDIEINFGKVKSSGVSASTIAAACIRQAAALHMFRLAMESGTPVDDLLRRATPAIHFSRVKAVRTALELWTSNRLERVIGQLGDTSLEVRKSAKLAHLIAQRALISIVMAARRKE
ncbi:MAG TPA: DNA polymerase III subunit delta [Xanthobacteraceae bacterium]|jgi:DNA polymerase-3 subunit delta|nr:DNA polymerase III subunit delta [Xanthobacteraceae bacterium]